MLMFMNLLLLSFISLSLSACVTNGANPFSALPAAFTTENIMQVHQGMSSDEILAMFGKPKNVDVAVCGRPPNQWTCTTWEYGEFPYETASFTFNGKHNSLRLNNFEVERD